MATLLEGPFDFGWSQRHILREELASEPWTMPTKSRHSRQCYDKVQLEKDSQKSTTIF